MSAVKVNAELGGNSYDLSAEGTGKYYKNVPVPLNSSVVKVVAFDAAGNQTEDKSQILKVIGEWTSPKIDWSGEWDGSAYVGDYFGYIDYNRIKNNLLFLIGYASQMYDVTNYDFGEEKVEAEPIYADEINMFEDALETVNAETYGFSFEKKTWRENKPVPSAEDYNRIESMELKLYETLVAQRKAQRALAFRLGSQKGFKV